MVDTAARAAPGSDMIDPFGRHVTYLRVSVTDRCDFRCVYCCLLYTSDAADE